MMVSLASLATVLSAVLDHAPTGWENPWLWAPTVVGVFATLTALALASIPQPRVADVQIYLAAMALLVAVGLLALLDPRSEAQGPKSGRPRR
ncbi:MAG: hypothetical protein Kow00129_13280 [Thermoleophilia bacterium]